MDCPPSCSQPPFSGTHSKHQIYPPEIRETTAFSVQKMSIFRPYFEDDLYKNLFCRATTVTGSAKCCPHTERGHWVNLWSNIFSSYQGRNDFFRRGFSNTFLEMYWQQNKTWYWYIAIHLSTEGKEKNRKREKRKCTGDKEVNSTWCCRGIIVKNAHVWTTWEKT